MDATIHLLATGGVDATTMEAIAATAGVGLPSIYRRWASREDLIADVVVRVADRDIPVPDTGDLRTDLVQLLHDIIHAMSTPFGRASVALVAWDASNQPDREGESPGQRRRRNDTQHVLDRAKLRGELPADVDTDKLLDLLVAPIWLTLMVWRRDLKTIDVEFIVDTVLGGPLVVARDHA